MDNYSYRYTPYSVPTSMHRMHPYAPFPAGQVNHIIHTDDAGTKLTDRVKRKCYNCQSTETSTWRRSSLAPGKVLCNKCGLYERTHSRPRPEKFSHKRKPVSAFTTKPYHPTPLSRPRIPSMSSYPISPPPRHYDHHASIAALAHHPDSEGSCYSDCSYASSLSGAPRGSPTDLRNLLNGSSPDMISANPQALSSIAPNYIGTPMFASSDNHAGFQ